MTSDDLRRSYIDFFVRRGHTEIPGGSLIPSDSSVLFTTAGIQPLVPYFGGAPHPSGKRLVDVQRCLRTVDIEEVGDNTHLTCFEMLGNWSLGDYGKRESLAWTLELFVEVFGFDFERLSVTVFEGDEHVPFDQEAYDRWIEVGMPPERIRALGRADNWWGPPGPHGPCGPDSEVFYDGVELGNNVFITHEQLPDGSIVPLAQGNIDVGMGLERIACILQGVESVYETDLFAELMSTIREHATTRDQRAERIVADHVRSSLWLLEDGIRPSNTDQGYVLRRLIRRAIRQGRKLGFELRDIVEHPVLDEEERKFASTLERGLRELERLDQVDGRELFRLFETYGLPPELSVEELGGVSGWEEDYERAAQAHRERSRAGAEQRFRGGLAGDSERIVRMHTATHLLGAALREVLGDHVHQRGSNITDQRLRFDFSHGERLTDSQLARVQAQVNDWVAEGIDVERLELPREQAEALGAEREFGQRYPDIVSVYVIGESSKEFCGGPHVANTREVGPLRILKQESSSAGVRRIKATVDEE